MGRPLADVLQQRLERVWTLLRMPVMQKLNMVLKYTDRDNAHVLELAIDAYEYAAASLQVEEALVDELNRANGHDVPPRPGAPIPPPPPRPAKGVEAALASVRVHIDRARERLLNDFGDTLTVDGLPV